MKHTPGPWKILSAAPGEDPDYGIHAEGCKNVLAEAFAEFKAKGIFAREEAQANALLIAAAPDLFDAAVLAIDYLGSSYELKRIPALDALLLAVRKATGVVE